MKLYLLLFLAIVDLSCQSQSAKLLLDPKTFQAELSGSKNAIVLDVRTQAEFDEGFIANALNIDFNSSDFESSISKLDKSKTYFVYCLSGGRSGQAAKWMRDHSFAHVFELKGGLLAWQKDKLPLVTSVVKSADQDKISMEAYVNITSSDKIVLIDFYAPWCIPCKQMSPILDEIAAEYKGKASIIRINIDENKKLAQNLKIDEIPFFKLYKEGKEFGNYIGQMDKASFKRILDN